MQTESKQNTMLPMMMMMIVAAVVVMAHASVMSLTLLPELPTAMRVCR